MVVYYADGLEVGIDDGGADEFEASLFEILADAAGKWRGSWDVVLSAPVVHDGDVIHVSPDECVEASEFLDHIKEELRVDDSCGDFATVADNARV